MQVSAVILSAAPVSREIPGVKVAPFVSTFRDAAGLLASRFEAIRRVETEWFFMLDDTDELPVDYPQVLDACMSAGTPLAYTDEQITAADGTSFIRKSGPYSEDRFIADFTLIHHLAVCRTDAALRAIQAVPQGLYAFENLLYFQVAKEGATYIEGIGYVWHRRGGLSRDPSLLIGQVQSATWAHRNKS